MTNKTPYLHELPKSPGDGNLDDKVVLRALQVKNQGQEINDERQEELERVQDDYELAFSAEDQQGMLFCNSTLAANVEKKVFERLDFMNFDIEFKNPDVPFEQKILFETLAKEAIKTVMIKGGFAKVMKEAKDSAYWRIVLLGDAFVVITKGEGDFPIEYRLVSHENVFIPANALALRGSASGRDARRILIVSEYEYDDYMENVVSQLDKKNKKKAKEALWGKLPGGTDYDDFATRDTIQQEYEVDLRVGEVGTYIDLEMEKVVKIVGPNATIIEELEGKDFPFKKDGKPFIPVAHFMCMPSTKGFYNYGVGHYMHQKNAVDRLLKNKTISGVLQEIDPIKYIQGKPGGRLEFQGLVYQAEQQIAEGHIGIIYDEADENGMYATGKVDSLSGKNASNIQEIAKGILREDIIDFGISLQETATEASKTATAIISEQETANILIREIAKRNAPEYKFLIETTIEYMKLFIKKNNKQKINVSEVEPFDDFQREFIRSVNLGEIVDFIRKNEYEVNMDINSGVAINPAVKAAKVRAMLQASVNTQLYPKILQKHLGLLGGNYDIRELQPQQQPEQPNGQIQEQELPPMEPEEDQLAAL